MTRLWIIGLIIIALPTQESLGQTNSKKDNRGLLPELNQSTSSESEADGQALKSELLITKTENKAIEALQSILKKKRGTAQEPDFLNRLAELYMRKSKSGRFFDLQRAAGKSMSTFPLAQQSGSEWIIKALKTYEDILIRFPKFSETDAVLFNSAFAYQQLNQKTKSEIKYKSLLDRFPKSIMVPDTLLALGELIYDQGRFSEAKSYFEKIENYPESRVYVYGLYKLGWALYNLKNTDEAVKKLKIVIDRNPPDSATQNKKGYYLRKEAIRDLVLFVGEVYPSEDLYDFFQPIVTAEELGPTFFDMAKLYDSYSRLKDVHIFLNEFIKKEEDNSYVVKSHLLLVDTYETIKKRDQVISELTKVADKCKHNSDWKLKQSPEVATDSCQVEFKKADSGIDKEMVGDLAKNKSHTEFSTLTETLLKLIIQSEDPQNPELKTRVILAELQFQLEKYLDASDNYYFVATRTTDMKEAHDTLYASLFAREKSIEKKKTETLLTDKKSKSIEYITRFPKGEHAHSVSLSLAVIYYGEKDYEKSLGLLYQIIKETKDLGLKTKSEDLVLDIFNLQKKYPELKNLAKTYLDNSKDTNRKKTLEKIYEESHFSEIQIKNQNLESNQKISNLLDYYGSHKGSELGKQSLLDALKLMSETKQRIDFTKYAEVFLNTYKDYPKKDNLIRDLVATFNDLGMAEKSAQWSTSLSEIDSANRNTHLETAADFYLIEGKNEDARNLYQKILRDAKKEKRTELFAKIKSTLNSKTDQKEIDKINTILLEMNVEPFATEILTAQAQSYFDQKDFKKTYDLTLKILKRDSSSELRAKARFIQGQIFESEFTSQSLKTSKEDRLGLLIQMKTEKLEKVQAAYLGTTKMTSDKSLIQSSLQAIDRSYEHYITSLKNISLPESLSPEEQNELKSELNKVITSVEQKRIENQSFLGTDGSPKVAGSINWSEIPAQSSPSPSLTTEVLSFLTIALPLNIEKSDSIFSRNVVKECSINKPEDSLLWVYSCLSKNNLKAYDLWLLKNLETGNLSKALWAQLYMTFLKGNKLKAQWILEKLLKENSTNKNLIEYNLKLTNQDFSRQNSFGILEYLKDLKDASYLSLLSKTVILYQNKKYQELSDLDYEWSQTPEFNDNPTLREFLIPLLAESLAQTENTEKAIKLLDTLKGKDNSKQNEVYILKARIFEVFKKSPQQALYFYELANKESRLTDRKVWLSKKLDFLKNQ